MVNVGIIGFGTVGSGAVKILINNKEIIKARSGIEINIKKIADLDIKSDRGVKLPDGMLTIDANEIINDPEIDVAVELIGGMRPAKDFILDALRKDKDIVTANKALLAEEGWELFAEAKKLGRTLAFEAAVAGGIPVIKALREGLAANNIIAIYGIINGTSNYILTKMTHNEIDFNEALKDAQRLGYAEADPAFDIDGFDAAHKLTLLSSLAYGIPLSYDKVYKEGITAITSQDIVFARELGYKIKPLAITKAINNEIELRVHPTMIPENYMISKVDGVFNAVHVIGDAVGETLFYGKGAGDMPTGSAIVSDIIDIAKKRSNRSGGKIQDINTFKESHLPFDKNSRYKIKEMKDIESMYFFRFTALDEPGVLSMISGILGEKNISISAVIQKERRVGKAVPLVVLSHKARESDVLDALNEIDRLSVVPEPTVFIRVESKD